MGEDFFFCVHVVLSCLPCALSCLGLAWLGTGLTCLILSYLALLRPVLFCLIFVYFVLSVCSSLFAMSSSSVRFSSRHVSVLSFFSFRRFCPSLSLSLGSIIGSVFMWLGSSSELFFEPQHCHKRPSFLLLFKFSLSLYPADSMCLWISLSLSLCNVCSVRVSRFVCSHILSFLTGSLSSRPHEAGNVKRGRMVKTDVCKVSTHITKDTYDTSSPAGFLPNKHTME